MDPKPITFDCHKHIWVPGQAVTMKLQEFTRPLSRLATHFTEKWSLQPASQGTVVTRSFQMYPTRLMARSFL